MIEGSAAMSDIALYYPYVHPRDDAWLKNAVLFWPMIERIVPGGYLVTDTETGRLLQKKKILTEREPGLAATAVGEPFATFVEEHAEQLRKHYSLRAAEALEPQIGWNDEHFDLRFGWVHGKKVARKAVQALCAADLAMEAYDDWIGMHPALSDVYMCALAAEMAAAGETTPITDQELHHVAAEGWTFDDLGRALLPDEEAVPRDTRRDDQEPEDVVVALAFQSVVVPNMSEVPIERVVKLREDYGADFDRFRTRVDELLEGVSDLGNVKDPQALAHHIDVRYRDTVAQDLQQLRDILRDQRFEYVDAAASLSVVTPTAIAANALADVTTAGIATGAMTALGAWKTRRAMRVRRTATMAASPATWLLRIERELAPRDLVGRVAAVRRRFLS
jgi:hypothetical protein